MSDQRVEELQKELDSANERADRLEIETYILWEMVAKLRDLSTKLNLTALAGYEEIKKLEAPTGMEKEVSMRLAEKRRREAEAARKKS